MAIVIMLLRIIIHCLQNAVRLSVREVQGFVGDAVGEDALAKHVETDMLQPRATVLHPESPVHLPDQVLGFHDADVLDPFRLRERIRIPCRHIQEQAAQGMRQAWQAVHTSNVSADAGAVYPPVSRHVFNQEPGSLQLQAVCRVLGVMCQHLFQFSPVLPGGLQRPFQRAAVRLARRATRRQPEQKGNVYTSFHTNAIYF